MLLKVVNLVVLISLVKCQEADVAVTPEAVDTQNKLGVVYLIPIFQKLPKKENENEENLNEIDDESEIKVLPLPRLLLILAPASNKELPDDGAATQGVETTPRPQGRIRRSPSGFGGGCNTCGYNPGGGGGHGGGGQGHGGGGTGTWSSSSSSASSGSWGGGGGGSSGKYQHGRK